MKTTALAFLAVLLTGCATERPAAVGQASPAADTSEPHRAAPAPAPADEFPTITVAHSPGGREEYVIVTHRDDYNWHAVHQHMTERHKSYSLICTGTPLCATNDDPPELCHSITTEEQLQQCVAAYAGTPAVDGTAPMGQPSAPAQPQTPPPEQQDN